MLYAQNGKIMVKNAIWLSLIMWVLAFLVFLVMLAPAAAFLYYDAGRARRLDVRAGDHVRLGGEVGLIEPFCIAALMQVYFKVIAGQVPDPDWDRRLSRGLEILPRAEGRGDGVVRRARRCRARNRADRKLLR